LVEQGADATILEQAKTDDVAFLVIGDPLGATTHTDLVLRARQLSIPTQIVHNASIITAVGVTGLQLYSFGETVSIPFWTESWKPDSFWDKIAQNKQRGLHTLCLLGKIHSHTNLIFYKRNCIKYNFVYHCFQI
jgi:diphthine synthase